MLLLGRSGVVTQWLQAQGVGFGSIYGMGGVVLVYTLTLYPYVLLPAIAAFKAVDVSMEEAAQNLGSSPGRTIFTVTLPIVMPAILAGGLLVFIETLENFGVPFVLAEDMPIFSVEAFKLFIGETAPNPSSAGVLGVLLILTTAAVLLVQRRFLGARRFATNARQAAPLLKVGAGLQAVATVYCWTIVILALVPFFSIVVLSFLEFRGPVLHPHFSLDNFGFLFSRALRPLANTLVFATVAAVCVTLIGVPIGYVVARYRSGVASLLDVLATLPFAVAGTVLAIGFIVSFNAGALILTGGPVILVLAYTVRKVPFAVRSASAIVHQIDASLEEASISLGRSPLQTFLRIVVPLMLGGVLSGMVLSWVPVASELSATVVLYSGPWSTLTVVMFQALESGGAGIATAAASFLIVVSLLPIALLYRLVRRYELS